MTKEEVLDRWILVKVEDILGMSKALIGGGRLGDLERICHEVIARGDKDFCELKKEINAGSKEGLSFADLTMIKEGVVEAAKNGHLVSGLAKDLVSEFKTLGKNS